jgi:hypothetical protein
MHRLWEVRQRGNGLAAYTAARIYLDMGCEIGFEPISQVVEALNSETRRMSGGFLS